MNKVILVGATAILSFTAGSLSSYFYATKKLGEAFDRAVEDQVDKEMDAIAKRQNKSELALQAAQERLKQIERGTVGPVVVDLKDSEKVFYNNVLPAVQQFALEHAPPAVATEALARYKGLDPESHVEVSEDHPYQITDGMFQEDDFTQIQLTYYAGDGVLADDRDDVIEDPATLVGVEFPKWFGDLSGDENVVFIRNGAREADFEITRSEGKYSEEVAGFLPEPEHRGEDE
jgi:hypothetical protein